MSLDQWRVIDDHRSFHASYVKWQQMTLEHLDGGLLDVVPELRHFVPPARIFDKMTYSPGRSGKLHRIFQEESRAGDRHCVLAAVLGAIDLGYCVKVLRIRSVAAPTRRTTPRRNYLAIAFLCKSKSSTRTLSWEQSQPEAFNLRKPKASCGSCTSMAKQPPQKPRVFSQCRCLPRPWFLRSRQTRSSSGRISGNRCRNPAPVLWRR